MMFQLVVGLLLVWVTCELLMGVDCETAPKPDVDTWADAA